MIAQTATASSDLRQYIEREGSLDLTTIRYVRERLPEPAGLDSWLEAMAAEHAVVEFSVLIAAAIMDGRDVDARHLSNGFSLRSNDYSAFALSG